MDPHRKQPAWRQVADGVAVVAPGLARLAGVRHGFSTAQASAGEPFGLGSSLQDEASFAARRERFLRAIGLPGAVLAAPRQVHGATVARARELDPGRPADADAVIALAGDRPRRAPGVRTADCVPILLAAADGSAVAAIHAGWRGTAAGVARRTVERLAALGIEPGRLRAALGPAIGGCCYEVSSEVARAVARGTGVAEEQVRATGSRGSPLLDLPLANRIQLQAAGLPGEAIDAAPWCTRCSGERFFSHRRQGAAAGRMLACIGWEAARGLCGPP